MNVIAITGRLGKDPEMKYTPQGQALTKISVANNTGWGDNEKTTWFPVEIWGQNAEFVNQYGSKGRLVSVKGEMVCDEYEKDGEKKYYWKIQSARVEFLDKVDNPGSQEDFPGI